MVCVGLGDGAADWSGLGVGVVVAVVIVVVGWWDVLADGVESGEAWFFGV